MKAKDFKIWSDCPWSLPTGVEARRGLGFGGREMLVLNYAGTGRNPVFVAVPVESVPGGLEALPATRLEALLKLLASRAA